MTEFHIHRPLRGDDFWRVAAFSDSTRLRHNDIMLNSLLDSISNETGACVCVARIVPTLRIEGS